MKIKKRIHISDTDATGVVYYPQVFRLVTDSFEELLANQGFHLCDYLLPIVHAEADYLSLIRAWDHLDITIKCTHFGTTSFTIEADLDGRATVKVVHVVTNAEGQKQPIPEALQKLLTSTLGLYCWLLALFLFLSCSC